MIRGEVDLPVWALAACLRWENLGEGHPVIAEAPLWRSAWADRENDGATRAALGERGLLDRRGRPDAGFRDMLAVLARPGVEFSCWAKDADGSYRALVAAVGGDAVLAVRVGGRIWLRCVSPQRLAEELVAQLPMRAPARAHAMNVRRSDYDALRAPSENVLGRAGADDEARRLLAVLRQPRLYAAELHAGTRDRCGIRRRAGPLTMLDTDQGRWLIARKPGRTPAEDWVVATPGGPHDLVTALYDLRAGTH